MGRYSELIRGIGVITKMELSEADIKEFEHNAKANPSLCQGVRKEAHSCAECQEHGECRIAEYYDWRNDLPITGIGQLTIENFI